MDANAIKGVLCGLCLVGAHALALIYDGDALKVVVGIDAGIAAAYFGIQAYKAKAEEPDDDEPYPPVV